MRSRTPRRTIVAATLALLTLAACGGTAEKTPQVTSEVSDQTTSGESVEQMFESRRQLAVQVAEAIASAALNEALERGVDLNQEILNATARSALHGQNISVNVTEGQVSVSEISGAEVEVHLCIVGEGVLAEARVFDRTCRGLEEGSTADETAETEQGSGAEDPGTDAGE